MIKRNILTRMMCLAVYGCLTGAFFTSTQVLAASEQKLNVKPRNIIAHNSIEHFKPKRRARRRQSDKFSNIQLTTQHGRKVRFYDDLIKDKVVMINLMYTTCAKICPANSARLVLIHELMEQWMGRDITMLSLSIDGEIDSPARLNAYWKAFGSKPGWLFLTGDYGEIDQLRRELGVYDLDPVIDADKTQHSGVLTIGNDRTDRWIALPILMHEKELATSILRNMWDEQWRYD